MEKTILRLGAEGGSLRLIHDEDRGFALEKDETGAYDLLTEDDLAGLPPAVSRSEWLTWPEAMGLLDRYRWHKMMPLFVHPEYTRQIVHALRKRGVTDGQEATLTKEAWGSWIS